MLKYVYDVCFLFMHILSFSFCLHDKIKSWSSCGTVKEAWKCAVIYRSCDPPAAAASSLPPSFPTRNNAENPLLFLGAGNNVRWLVPAASTRGWFSCSRSRPCSACRAGAGAGMPGEGSAKSMKIAQNYWQTNSNKDRNCVAEFKSCFITESCFLN